MSPKRHQLSKRNLGRLREKKEYSVSAVDMINIDICAKKISTIKW